MTHLATFSAGVAMLAAGPALAVTIDFTATVAEGPFTGESGTGTLTYDASLLTGAGIDILGRVPDDFLIVDPTLDLVLLTPEGSTFTASNDADFPDFPKFVFDYGDLTFVSYALVSGVNGFDFSDFGIAAVFFDELTLLADGSADIVGVVQLIDDAPAPVPLPASLPLLLGGLGAFGLSRRRRAARRGGGGR